MKIRQQHPFPSRTPSNPETFSFAIDRREFLRYAAATGAVAAVGRNLFGQAPGAAQQAGVAGSGESRLPDGTEFVAWEQPLTFSKTYYVDNQSAKADDNGPGTKSHPFRTVNKAAQVLMPGERVVIASGIYRECVRPARGGASPAQMISYEAAPGAKVFIRGSEVLKDGWEEQSVSAGRFGGPTASSQGASQVTVWRHELSGDLFPDGYQPFALASVAGNWEWLDPRTVDMGPYFRRRGLVFADGKPLEPVEQLRELASPHLQPEPVFTTPPVSQNGLPPRRRGGPIMQEVGGTPDARFWVSDSGTMLYIRLASGTPADHLIEVTTRQQAFVPSQKGLGFIRIKGIAFQHAANVYPFPQYGQVSTVGGNHWIIEDNTIEWANAVGLDIGSDGDSGFAPQSGASQIVRGNTIRYCGVEGIGGMGTRDTLVEDNLIEWCGWADAERGWEAAGAKFHFGRNLLFRRNVVRHIRHANGVWLDSNNTNCRISSNVFADVVTVSAAVHMEMNLEQNQIDNNVIWNVRNAEPGTPGQRGCAGSGVFINATDRLIIAQNLIGRCDNSGVYAITRPDRAHSGTATGNNIANNIFASCGKSAIVFLNPNNSAEGNLYVSMPGQFLGFFTGATQQWLDLSDWRESHGWDKSGAMFDAQIDLDPDSLELKLSSNQPFPQEAIVNQIDTDILGKATGQTRPPGPLADPAAARAVELDPRKAT
ncbi:MAG TPA: right-handed parallel beta-helix repeat-containing protein [Terracidiphilus sp.]|nr:right-handed parallel beta-helix repeat-containing protein [Terracidiphilus sp.]